MLAADRAHVPLWDLLAQPTVYRELYRVAVMAERAAEHEMARQAARRQRMREMLSGGSRGRRR